MEFFNPKRLSCGIVILSESQELLLCHVTGQNHWDLPKGGIDAGEQPIDAALRETREETGLQLDAEGLTDLGQFAYTAKKDLHLFATLMPRIDLSELRCDSEFSEHASGRRLPEMDAYDWVRFDRLSALCTPKMSIVLRSRLDLEALLQRLSASRQALPVA